MTTPPPPSQQNPPRQSNIPEPAGYPSGNMTGNATLLAEREPDEIRTDDHLRRTAQRVAAELGRTAAELDEQQLPTG